MNPILSKKKRKNEPPSISIRQSFIAFAVGMLLLILVIATITAFTYRAFIVDLQTYSVRMTALNDLAAKLLDDSNRFSETVTGRTGSDDAAYQQARTAAQAFLAQTRNLFRDPNEQDAFLLFQAIDETYSSYTSLCADVFRLQSRGLSHILVYYDALTAARYCSSYAAQLSRINADNCMRICGATISLMSASLMICFAISALGVAITAIFWRYAGRNLIRPLSELTEEAAQISDNQLDLPDIARTNNQEMNRLIAGFNRMKCSMQQSLLHLQQINRMETELHQNEMERLETERLLEQAQLGMLRSQMNPHFLFNTLNIIASMAEIEHAQTTRDLITNLAGLFRYNLQNPQNMTTLEDEVQICRKYISIQQLRFGNRIRFELDCQEETFPSMIPIFTLQPLLENAVIHGMCTREKDGHIRVRAQRYGDLVTIRVTDNGSGVSRAQADKVFSQIIPGDSGGIGLPTVKKRIEMSCRDGALVMRGVPGLGTSVQISYRI